MLYMGFRPTAYLAVKNISGDEKQIERDTLDALPDTQRSRMCARIELIVLQVEPQRSCHFAGSTNNILIVGLWTIYPV